MRMTGRPNIKSGLSQGVHDRSFMAEPAGKPGTDSGIPTPSYEMPIKPLPSRSIEPMDCRGASPLLFPALSLFPGATPAQEISRLGVPNNSVSGPNSATSWPPLHLSRPHVASSSTLKIGLQKLARALHHHMRASALHQPL